MLVLDRENNWKVIEEIKLDIGPRHFDMHFPNSTTAETSSSSGSDVENLIETATTATATATAATESASEVVESSTPLPTNLPELLPKDLRRGDRVRIALHPEDIKQQNKALRKLAAQGISVELVTVPTSSAAPRITSAENLGPEELFHKYAAMRGLNKGIVARGNEILSQVLRQNIGGTGDDDGGGKSSSAAAELRYHQHRQVSLSFSAVELEGYFSFIEPQRYDLQDRGLVVVTGQIQSAAGEASKPADGAAESNGAGKTALVMAPLWALTGDVDARSELGSGRGLTNADIVNEDSKFARVKLEGMVDGVPFTVERKVVRRGRGGGLTFELDGVDKTTQDVRLTQAEIDAVLGTALLGRAAFYGQSEITALLESSDRAFKEELGKIVDLDIWADAKEASRRALTVVKSSSTEVATKLQLKEEYLEQQRVEAERLEARQRTAAAEVEVRRVNAREKLVSVEREMHGVQAELETLVQTAAAWLDGARDAQEQELSTNLQDPAALEELSSLEKELSEARQALAAAQVEQGGAQATAAAKHRQLEDFLLYDEQFKALPIAATSTTEIGENIYHDHEHDSDKVVCDRCFQPISAEQVAATSELLAEEHETASVAASEAMEKTRVATQRVKIASDAVKNARERQMAEMRAAATEKAQAAQLFTAIENSVCDGQTALKSVVDIVQRIFTVLKHAEDSSTINSTINLEGEKYQISDTTLGNSNDSTSMLTTQPQELVQALRRVIHSCTSTRTTATSVISEYMSTQAEQSPLEDEIARKKEWIARETQGISDLKEKYNALSTETEDLKAIDEAFRPTGIVSYVLEGALGALQHSANQNLSQLSPGIALELAASRPRANSSNKDTADSVIEQVEKKVLVRVPGSSEVRQRSVRQLSGGERRRVALALALGFTELAARRGRLRCDLLVLDEVMQHLDGEGCARLAALLRGLDQFGTVLVVAQAQSFMTRAFDGVDVVIKASGGGSDTNGVSKQVGSVIMMNGGVSGV